STGGSCKGGLVPAGETCWFETTFFPRYQGHWTDGVTIKSPDNGAGAAQLLIPLDGTFSSTDTLRATPSVMNFGTVNTGGGWNSVAIWNTTPQAIGPLTLAVTGNSNFSIFDGSACEGKTLAAGEVCRIKVQYTPTFTGRFTGTLTVS